jgi:hypothetical protein
VLLERTIHSVKPLRSIGRGRRIQVLCNAAVPMKSKVLALEAVQAARQQGDTPQPAPPTEWACTTRADSVAPHAHPPCSGAA